MEVKWKGTIFICKFYRITLENMTEDIREGKGIETGRPSNKVLS